MLRIVSLCFVFVLTLEAQTLDALVSHALENHDSLKAIEQRLSSYDETLQLSQKFQNPELSLSVGDIQFDDIANRSMEPMQYESISFKQKIPYFGKRDAAYANAAANKEIVFASLEEAKVALVREIKLSAYTIWEYEKKRSLVDESTELVKKNIELAGIYTGSSDEGWHMEMSTLELSLAELKIKRKNIEALLRGLYARISYLSAAEVSSLALEVSLVKPSSLEMYLQASGQNKSYLKKIIQIEEKNTLTQLKEMDTKIDPYVSVAYYHRDAFEDYVSVSVGAVLPVYGSEALSVQKARKEALEASYAREDFVQSLRANISQEYANLLAAYETYSIIKEESLVELEHMLELADASVKNGKTLTLYTKLLEKRVALYETQCTAEAAFQRAQTNLEALQGEIQ